VKIPAVWQARGGLWMSSITDIVVPILKVFPIRWVQKLMKGLFRRKAIVLDNAATRDAVQVVLRRLGEGLVQQKIAIFAKSPEHEDTIKNVLKRSQLFSSEAITIRNLKDIDMSEGYRLFIVYWQDFKNEIKAILNIKKSNTAMIVYAPKEDNNDRIDDSTMKDLDETPGVAVANFRGRLLSDIIMSLITTGDPRP
jgi:hypothetical protein